MMQKWFVICCIQENIRPRFIFALTGLVSTRLSSNQCINWPKPNKKGHGLHEIIEVNCSYKTTWLYLLSNILIYIHNYSSVTFTT